MRMEFLTTRRWSRFVVVLLLAVVLTACGTDDGEDDPTATSAAEGAQPTVAVEEGTAPDSTPDGASAESSPTNTDMSNVSPSEIEDAGVATPAVEVAGSPDAVSPAAEGEAVVPAASLVIDDTATPVSVNTSATPASTDTDGTPDGVMEGDPVVGDGTTGASLEPVGVATPAAAGASPVASPMAATPAAQTTVTGCEVANVPAFTGQQSTYAITTDVMFRTGPGADCELAFEVPLGEFQQVVVTGGPVINEDDGSEWVRITVNGTEGWVSFAFLEPVS